MASTEFIMVAAIGVLAIAGRFVLTVAAVVAGLWVWERWGARLGRREPAKDHCE